MKDKNSWTPFLMFLVIWAFIGWMAYSNVFIKMAGQGFPGGILWPSFAAAMLISGLIVKPIFVYMLSGFLSTIDEFLKSKR